MKVTYLLIGMLLFGVGILVGINYATRNHPKGKTSFCALMGKDFFENYRAPEDDQKTFLDIETELTNLCNVVPQQSDFQNYIKNLQTKYE